MSNFALINSAVAQENTTQNVQSITPQSAGQKPQQSPFMSFVPFIAIFFIFYFLMIRPEKKKMQKQKELLDQLKKGDEVYTKSGIIGTIFGLTDKLVTLEVSEGVRMKVLRSQIAGSSKAIFEESNANDAKASKKMLKTAKK